MPLIEDARMREILFLLRLIIQPSALFLADQGAGVNSKLTNNVMPQ
jgi:hypothetical protein